MKTKYFFLAAFAATFASCANEEYIGDNSPNAALEQTGDGSIQFGFDMQNMTRADIAGDAAATILGNNFYVTGTKGTEGSYNPSPTLVFDNYLVHYGANTAGKTESNTANWEYVGIVPGTTTGCTNKVKLSDLDVQTIKYWDYSAAQYDFMAFSTGTFAAVNKTNLTGVGENQIGASEIGVTKMLYGEALNVESTVPTAYTFYVPNLNALKQAYISDIVEVTKAGGYGKDVVLKFKNIGSKIRMALYETVPGYSVKDVKFYTEDKADASVDDLGNASETHAHLIGADNSSFITNGTIQVRFPHVGNTHDTKQDYDKADASVTPTAGTYDTYKDFGAFDSEQLKAAEHEERNTAGNAKETGNVFLARTLSTASFAGDKNAHFYTPVFPNTTAYPITLRVDYTLVPIDGAKETIKVKGAKAVVPSTYTRWLPNYAYTYIFKISDNTNGWTGTTVDPKGLFPITFDAVVTEATDATAEQKTITTVATPTVTTYQQYHKYGINEYSKTVKNLKDEDAVRDVYVQVMNNTTVPATFYKDMEETIPGETSKIKALLYKVDDDHATTATEALVMDALQNRTVAVTEADVTGRNGITLTNNTNINATVTTIINGVDDNPIEKIDGVTIEAGQVAKIDMSAIDAGTYAFVYDYTNAAKTPTTIYQLIPVTPTEPIGTSASQKFCSVTKGVLDGIDTSTPGNVTTDGEAVNSGYVYFSKTTDGSANTTYSFVSVEGKTNLIAGLVKCPVGSLTTDVIGTTPAAANTYYFTTYFHNTGDYAVKVIKVVD